MIQSKAILVSLCISQWCARKLDHNATAEVSTTHNAAKDAGRYNKLLVSKQETEAIQKIVGQARSYHYETTLIWGDSAERLLPTEIYFDYIREMGEYKNAFDHEVTRFCNRLDEILIKEEIRLGTLWKPSDYPSQKEIRNKFSFEMNFMPIPAGSHLQLDLEAHEIEKIQKKVEADIDQRITGAVNDVWLRIKEKLVALRDVLSQEDKIFRNSLFDNISELAMLIPRMNVTGNPKIAEISRELQNLLISPDVVRTNPVVRDEKAGEADAILRKFKNYFA